MRRTSYTAEMLKSNLAYSGHIVADCRYSMSDIGLSQDDREWLKRRAAQQIRDLEGIIAAIKYAPDP